MLKVAAVNCVLKACCSVLTVRMDGITEASFIGASCAMDVMLRRQSAWPCSAVESLHTIAESLPGLLAEGSPGFARASSLHEPAEQDDLANVRT